ncbi:hypothetical protein V501_00506 [Pseudogymnoascus sp. VKM F-4519 (FW-2642)]|nr:hypothetical protein V501_00506 [Pseudogymnoascus sp. VKM F-4519 (FW-2642)]
MPTLRDLVNEVLAAVNGCKHRVDWVPQQSLHELYMAIWEGVGTHPDMSDLYRTILRESAMVLHKAGRKLLFNTECDMEAVERKLKELLAAIPDALLLSDGWAVPVRPISRPDAHHLNRRDRAGAA